MDVNYNTISTHLDIKKGINFLKNLKNKQNNFNDNFWNSDIYKKENYNNYIRTFPYFWLDNDNYDINNVYKLNELNEIPWYYDFRLYEDVLENMNIIDKKNLWKNFNYTEIYKNNNNLDEKHYIANDKILKTYIPRGYIIPPFDKNILNINKKNKENKVNKEIDDRTDDKINVINDKYTEIDNEIKEYINDNVDNVDNFSIIVNIQKLKKIAEQNFYLLDTDGDNIINYNQLQKLYMNLQNNNKDIIESFVNIIDSINNHDIINDKLINDNIHLDNNNSINKKNYINSVTLSYIKSEDFDKTFNYNKSINAVLIKDLNDKIKIMEEKSSQKTDTDIGDIDNNLNNQIKKETEEETEEEIEKNIEKETEDKEIENNYQKIHYDTWKETLIKIGLWTIGIIAIICILLFLSFVFIFDNNNNISNSNNEIIDNTITSVSNIEE